MIKIEFPAYRTDIALALGQALTAIGSNTPAKTPDVAPSVQDEPPTGEVKEPTEPGEGDPNGEASLMQERPKSLFEGAPLGGIAEGVESPGTDQPTTLPEASPADARVDENTLATARVDEKGVAFNPAFCGEATDPFNKSGKNKGQWKKKRGVDQADYDAWYADGLGKLPTLTAETATEQGSSTETSAGATAPETNAAAAFAGRSQAPQVQGGTPPADVPTDAGALMVWISEKQAGGLLTQDDVNEAYATTGVSTAELFGDNAAPHIAAIHTYLNARCVPA